MSQPPRRTLGDRLAWLLDMMPRRPGGDSLSISDILTALARANLDDNPWGNEPRAAAQNWLDAARSRPVGELLDPWSRRYLTTMESVLRLPPAYFHNDATATATDERIALANRARNIRVIGPCRVLSSQRALGELHALYSTVVAAVGSRSAS